VSSHFLHNKQYTISASVCKRFTIKQQKVELHCHILNEQCITVKQKFLSVQSICNANFLVMYTDLCVKCPLCLSDLNQNWNGLIISCTISPHQMSLRPIQWCLSSYVCTNGQSDLTGALQGSRNNLHLH
jgi:hypothetical protein